MSVTCLFGKGKALFLSTAQAAPQTNYKIGVIQHKHTIHINKQQQVRNGKELVISICFVFVVIRVLRFWG